MTESGRWALGALTGMSLVSLVFAIGAAMTASLAPEATAEWPPVALAVGIYHVIWTAMLLFFYFAHLVNRSGLDNARKAMWGVGFLFGAPFTLPVYWALHVRPGSEVDQSWDTPRGDVHVRTMSAEAA